MSFKAMKWVSEQQLPPGEFAVLMILADRANKQNVCWPGLKGISEKLGRTPRQIRNYLRNLEAAGLIKSEPRSKGKRQTSNRYTLQIPEQPPQDAQAELLAKLERWAADPELMLEAFREDAKKDGLTAREFMQRWRYVLEIDAPDLNKIKQKMGLSE